MKLNMIKLFTLTLASVWLGATSAQDDPLGAILDTDSSPLRRGVEYFIEPAAAAGDTGEVLTLVSRSAAAPCPLVLGEGTATSEVNPAVTFAPFDGADDVIREAKNFRVSFSGVNACGQSGAWTVGDRDATAAGRRLIGTSRAGEGDADGDYFYAAAFEGFENAYVLEWCPHEICPICKFDCGTVGLFVDENSGKRLFALDGNVTDIPFTDAFPIVFQRVYFVTQ